MYVQFITHWYKQNIEEKKCMLSLNLLSMMPLTTRQLFCCVISFLFE